MLHYCADFKRIFFLIAIAICANQQAYAQSDSPCGAPALVVASETCTYTTGTGAGASAQIDAANGGLQTCGITSGSSYVDTWFSFVAPESGTVTLQTQVAPGSALDNGAMMVYSGPCTALTEIGCNDVFQGSQMPGFLLNGLTSGETYYIRFWGREFSPIDADAYNICAFEPPAPPVNDECADAIPAVVNLDAYCNEQTSGTILGGTPSPQSNWCSGTANDDVWFTFVATSTSHYFYLNNIAGSTTDLSYQVFSGSCGALSNATCNFEVANNLIVGGTYFVRVWSNGSGNQDTTFDLCITSPAEQPLCGVNDPAGNTACEATPICNLDGYCGTTSGTYTADYWPELGGAFCNATIENNSFLSFVAEATTISFFVWVSNCDSPYGIQLMVFSADNCSSGAVTEYTCWNPGVIPVASTLITVPGLTIGEEYYITIDGNTGAICDYVIGAHEGIQTGVDIETITGATDVCLGGSIDMIATGGSGNYTWSPATDLSSATGDMVTYTPQMVGSETFNVVSANINPSCPSFESDITINTTDFLTGTDTESACESFTWIDGNTYTSSNNTATFTYAGGSVAGCDSVVTLDLTLNYNATGVDTQESCTPFTWIDGNTYTTSNNTATHTIVGGAVSGCDSIVTLDLTISNAVTGTDVQTACSSYTWIDGNTYTVSNNTATFTVVGGSVSGCDSIVTLDLTISGAVTGTDVQTACSAFTWIDGNTYTADNNTATFTIVGGSVAGCDSIVTLDLTISGAVTGTDIQTACDSYTWIDGINYTSSNSTATFTIVGGSVAGCDSIVTLDLTINNSTTGIDTQSACDSFTWIDGINYTSNNNTATFTIVGGAANGCDSVVTLDLTISNAASSTDTQTACGSYTWIDGVNYTTSNNTATFVIVGGSVAGCDSVITLDLTIIDAVTGTDTQIACGSYTWIDGNTYTSNNNTATYTFVGGSVAGCDSIVTLNLTIGNTIYDVDEHVACESYTWIDGNTYTSSNNTATYTIPGSTVAGCDSIILLDLTIGYTVYSTDVKDACGSYTWIDGNTYLFNNNTATYTFIGGAASGCDSIVSLDLIVSPNPEVYLGQDQYYCDDETVVLSPGDDFDTYHWSDGSASTSIDVNYPGVYTVYVTDYNGCQGSGEVEVKEECPFNIWVPNSFTPDGDEHNNLFYPVITGGVIHNYNMTVHDRWGQLVFQTQDIHGVWDGSVNGNGYFMESGVYIYQISISYMERGEPKTKEVVGHLTLLR